MDFNNFAIFLVHLQHYVPTFCARSMVHGVESPVSTFIHSLDRLGDHLSACPVSRIRGTSV